MPRIASLHVYPVKSCRGIDLDAALVTRTGIAHDREWMITSPAGRFLTQREEPRLAVIVPRLTADHLTLDAPGLETLCVSLSQAGAPADVVVWKDRCAAFDQGEQAADWLARFLGKPLRLVRFDPRHVRPSGAPGSGEAPGYAQFSDGYAMLVISTASLADLNARLLQALPMNRFRPSIVVDGLPAYGEDAVGELASRDVQLKLVKACTRCAITTTNQLTGTVEGDEPLRTLRTYRWDSKLHGVAFGQNAVVAAGEGATLRVGDTLTATLRRAQDA
jgi:uncharacterized protein YcbX